MHSMSFGKCITSGASLVALMVKNLPASARYKDIPSLGWEDLLEEVRKLTPVFLPGESHGQRSLV